MRKIALITYNHVQGFIRRPAWYVCVTVGLLGVLGIYWFVFSRIGGDIIIMGQTAYGQAVLTLTFMMMGIDLRREQRQEHLDDIIAAYPCLPWALPLTHIFTLVVMATAITTIIGVGCLIPLSLDGAPLLWLRKIALQIVLLYFLPCIILGTWGWLSVT